jgi:hypothetical protein
VNAANLLTLFGVLSGLLITGLGIVVTVLLSVLNRKNDTIEKLREANLNYRFALIQLGSTAEAVNKTLSSLPIPQPDGNPS